MTAVGSQAKQMAKTERKKRHERAEADWEVAYGGD